MAAAVATVASDVNDLGEVMPPNKVIALIDMDSFECQIYKRFYPTLELWGQPTVIAIVVDRTGRIVSATHAARDLGISRSIRLKEAQSIARQKKIHLKIFTKPNDREKPDAKEVRYATWDVLDVLKLWTQKHSFGVVLENSSCDEFYMDLTTEVNMRLQDADFPTVVESRTFLESEFAKIDGETLKHIIDTRYGQYSAKGDIQQEKRLVCGGLIMQEVNNFLFAQTKLIASVGVGSNKLTAKLAVSMNKPNGITILPDKALARVANDIKIEKIPGFGGNLGINIKEMFNISTMKELANMELESLEDIFGEEKGMEIFLKSRGISNEPVKYKVMSEEVSCSKNFFGQITSDETLQYHFFQLIEEMLERLAEERERHKRKPTRIRFLINYFLKNGGYTDKDILSWSHLTDYDFNKTSGTICNEVMAAVFEGDEIIDLNLMKVSKLEVRGKGFVTLCN